jgi:tyrosyl-tRNA synthetase
VTEHHAFGLTAPLVTKADGTKFGKTESGAIWLTADRTSPYAYYQFWLNALDADVANWIKIFTLLDATEESRSVTAATPRTPVPANSSAPSPAKPPPSSTAPPPWRSAEAAAKALFSGDIAGTRRGHAPKRSWPMCRAVERDRAGLPVDGLDLVDVLIDCKLATSKREAREFIASGSVTVNGQKVGDDPPASPPPTSSTAQLTAIRRGKKNWHVTRWA